MTVPRAFIPPSKQAFIQDRSGPGYTEAETFGVQKPSLLGNRTANGDMLGSPTKRYVSNSHVPYQNPNVPIKVRAPKMLPMATQAAAQSTSIDSLISTCNANNPVVTLTNEWCVCFDESAAALYYYSSTTGEATWIPPNFN